MMKEFVVNMSNATALCEKNTCIRKNVQAVGFSVAGAVGHNPCAGALHYACGVEEMKNKLKDMKNKLKDGIDCA